MSEKVFRIVYGLFVVADFSDTEAGLCAAPRVNHDQVDFNALCKLLADTFCYGPQAKIRVANDTIDQVTFHIRAGEVIGLVDNRDPACSDFGAAMLKLVSPDSGPIIDVRSAWSSLHFLPDRTAAPPPMLIPFVAESHDFYAAMGWIQQAHMMLGCDAMQDILSDNDDPEKAIGVMPDILHAGIEKIFGCRFERAASLMRLASSKPPSFVPQL